MCKDNDEEEKEEEIEEEDLVAVELDARYEVAALLIIELRIKNYARDLSLEQSVRKWGRWPISC